VPHDDGTDWTVISADPPVDREGGSSERLFTALSADPVEDAPSQRSVACPTWLEASPHATLRARGVISVTLQSDDGEMHSIRHRIDTELAAGTRSPDLPWDAPFVVDAADGRSVSCTVRFSPA
jgi:hypothetical protein